MTNEELYKLLFSLLTKLPKASDIPNVPIFRGWLEYQKAGVEVYLRKTIRYIDGKKRNTIEIANISVTEEEQRKGRCLTVIRACEDAARAEGSVSYVENAYNPILSEKLERIGYKELKELHCCFYKDMVL